MDLETRLRLASGTTEEITAVLYDHSSEVLVALLGNPRLTEDQVLVLLARKELPFQVLRHLADRHDLLKSYRVKQAVVRHPHAPRSLSLPLLRHIYLMDLVRVATTPGIPADLKRTAEEQVAQRAPTLPLGERMSLARQGSGRIAGVLLLDKERVVVETALNNPRTSSEHILKAQSQESMTAESIEQIATHPRWSCEYKIKLALLRHPQTSLARVLTLAGQVLRGDLLEIAGDPRMPANRRAYLARLAARPARPR